MRNVIKGKSSHQEYEQQISKTPSEDKLINPFIHFGQQSIEQTIVSRFEEQVLKFPEKAAICEKNFILNYLELNSLSNGLALKILELHQRSGNNIALLLENGRQAIVGMLGVLKTGNAYVPLDLNYPVERLKYIIKDTNCKLIIANSGSSQLATELRDAIKEGSVINIDQDIIPVIENVKPIGSPTSIAYILYTSGSTGEPKGVIQTHKNVLHFTRVWTNNLSITNEDRISLLSSYTFDSSVQDIYGALLNGASLFPYEIMQTDTTPLAEWLKENEISIVHTVPTVYRYFISTLKSEVFQHIRLIVLGGEATYKKDFEDFKHHFTEGTIFLNGYGATESSINLQKFLDHKSKVDKQIIPLGFAVEQTKTYLLKENDQEAVVGEKGEIVYKSDYLAIGYWNKREQTESVFTIDPITKSGRVYRSGDLGTMLPNGEIEFAGRRDEQVKIRGQRVELAEIEKNIINIPGVNGVSVAIKNLNDEDRIVAYIQSQQKLNASSIRKALQQSLPSYMLPDFYEFLEKFSLTRTGKINRRALPNPDITRDVRQEFIAPGTELEIKLADLWHGLLGVEQVGIHDNFFELGGHSLMAIRAVSAIRKKLEVEVTVKDIFSFPTLSQLAAHLETQQTGLFLPAVEAVHPRPERIPLSFSQEWLWFIDQLEGSVQYHIPMVLLLRGELNRKVLQSALHTIVRRHEVLRTVIREEEGVGYQYIKEQTDWQLSFVDGSHYQKDPQGLQHYIQEVINEPFDLSKDDMLRAVLITLTGDEQVLVLTMHHIASDGWSLSVFTKELVALYSFYIKGGTMPLEPLAIQYADYAIWQREHLQGELLEKKINYWKEKLHALTPLQLPTDYVRPVVQSTRGALSQFTIDKALFVRLQALSNKHGATLFMTALSAFKVLLYRYTAQEDICVGGVTAGRQQHEIENLIGCFINTLALRSEIKGEATFIELLQQVKATTLEAYEHQEAPIEKVVEAVAKQRDPSRHPLYQVMFVLQNIPNLPQVNVEKLILSKQSYKHGTTMFEITFTITETAMGYEGTVEYSTELYNEQTIQQMVGHFKQLLSSIIEEPEQKISELSMLTKEEEQQLLVEFIATKANYPTDKTIVDLFEEQVQKTPKNIAAMFEQQQLTYEELNGKANQLANELLSLGIEEGKFVPVIMSEGFDYLVAFIGILKTGAACVPLAIDWPIARIISTLKELSPVVTLVNEESSSLLISLEAKYNLKNINYQELDIDYTDVNNSFSNSIMCLFYTSGSTGVPKGVEIYHKGIANRFFWMNEYFNFPTKIVLKTTKNIFDSSIWQLIWPLINGGKTVLGIESRSYDLDNIFTLIEAHKITLIDFSPALFSLFVDHIIKNHGKYNITSLQDIILGGEAINVGDINTFKSHHPEIRITNLYGPTEASIGCVYYTLNKKEYNVIPIGIPIGNTQIYILGNKLQLVPVGVSGEIHIAGICLARGYLNRPDLTIEKFISNPFSRDPQATIYKTGDIGKWLPDGNIEYMGRKDDQVKIRGYRIELGEIESVLRQCDEVSEGVILAREDRNGNKILIGYVVPEGALNREAIKTYLHSKLPEYMIPVIWIELERLPLTPNGKVDKKALPEFNNFQILKENYVAPRNETEQMLAEIWEEVLEVEKVGMNNNFFELGGHSLVILKLASKIRKLGLQIEIKDFFKYQTIEQQSDFIKTSLMLLHTAGEGKFVIPIQPEGKNTPMFAFPEFLMYSKIGKHISKQQPFYSIEQSPYKKVKDVVNHYITEIKKIYPVGPYNLTGYCSWGNIAVEMAQTLIEQGDEVSVLVLIEYYNPKIKISRLSIKFIRNKIKFIIKKLQDNASFSNKRKFLSKELLYAFKYVNNKIRKSGLQNNDFPHKKFAGKVILFQSSETYGFKDDSHMGWKDIFIGEVKKYIIEGEHLGLMIDPYSTAQMAEILNKELQLESVTNFIPLQKLELTNI